MTAMTGGCKVYISPNDKMIQLVLWFATQGGSHTAEDTHDYLSRTKAEYDAYRRDRREVTHGQISFPGLLRRGSFPPK